VLFPFWERRILLTLAGGLPPSWLRRSRMFVEPDLLESHGGGLPPTNSRRVSHTLRDGFVRCRATNISLPPELQTAEMIFASSLLFYLIKHPSHHPFTSLRTSPSHWKDKPHEMHEMHKMHVLYHSAQMQRPARNTLRLFSPSGKALQITSCGLPLDVRKGYAFPTRSPRKAWRLCRRSNSVFKDQGQHPLTITSLPISPTHWKDSFHRSTQFSQNDTVFTKRTKRTNRSFLSVLARGKSLSYTRSEAECVGQRKTYSPERVNTRQKFVGGTAASEVIPSSHGEAELRRSARNPFAIGVVMSARHAVATKTLGVTPSLTVGLLHWRTQSLSLPVLTHRASALSAASRLRGGISIPIPRLESRGNSKHRHDGLKAVAIQKYLHTTA